MSGLVISPASRRELLASARAPFAYPVLGYIARRGDEVVALGGLSWRWQRCDMWLEVLNPDDAPAVTVVRWARRMLSVAEQMGETEVFCLRDEQHPTSEKLLTIVGFSPIAVQRITFTDGTSADKELWQWQASQRSQA